MEKHPIKNDRRAGRARRRQGEAAACVVCGYTGPAALQHADPADVERYLQRHHLEGKAYDAELWCWLCPTHHAEMTLDQQLHGVDLSIGERSFEEQLAAKLRSLGPALVRIGDALTKDGYRLDEERPRPDRDGHS